MSPNDILKEAEADLASLAGLPGEIRAKVKAGIAELTRIRDAIDTTIGTLTGSARATLTSLQSVVTQDAEAIAGAAGPLAAADHAAVVAPPAAAEPATIVPGPLGA